MRLVLKIVLVLVLAAILFALLSLAAFYVGWYFFGLAGHPAAPDVPPPAYLVYFIVAPLFCLGLSAWLVFKR